MTTGLVGVLALLASACTSSNGMAPAPGPSPDGAAGGAGGGAGGTTALAGGGTTGQAGSSSDSHGGQTGSLSQPDAGLLPDTARPLDLAVNSDVASAKPDLAPQPDTAYRPDAIARPDVAASPDLALDKDGKTSPDLGIVLHGLSPGTYCYRITSVVPGSHDGCILGVTDITGAALPGNYDASTGVFLLGKNGSLGGGVITYNQGTLVRDRTFSTDPDMPACSWNAAITTTLTMTDTNKFTVSVVERDDSIAEACVLPFTSCISTWTWTMEIDGTKVAPSCGN